MRVEGKVCQEKEQGVYGQRSIIPDVLLCDGDLEPPELARHRLLAHKKPTSTHIDGEEEAVRKCEGRRTLGIRPRSYGGFSV